MTETPNGADKQPDQADPQKEQQTAGKKEADQRRVLVCLNCGHIWEAKTGTLRPQCFDCKRQRTRAATPEEIAQYDQGETKISLKTPADSIPKNKGNDQQTAGKDTKNSADQADQLTDNRIDPLKLVDPSPAKRERVERLPEKKPGVSALPVVVLLMLLGVIAALYYIFARQAISPEIPIEYTMEEPPAPPRITAFAGLPGMG